MSLTLKGEQIAQKTPVRTPLSGHLSFPFLFAHEGEVYCLPESSAVRRLMLLRWTGAEFKEHATPLADVAAADSVLFEHEGYFWIAYTDLDIGTHDNLNLCFAKSLSGPWQTHPGNPVTLDPKTARSGGTPFRKDGTLYRPAQDCSETYGGAIRIMRITECTPERYREEEVTRIAPGKYGNPHGFHTLSACSDRCYVDGKRMVFSLANVARKAWRRIRAKVIPYKFLYTR